MASTTVCCKKRPEGRFWPQLLLAGLVVLACCWLNAARAGEIEIASPQLQASDDGYALSADFSFELNARLEDAVARGMVLHFLIEFELSKPRWYWLDEKSLGKSQTIRLSYHALTRQYRVTSGGLHQSFQSLTEALRVMSRLRNWQVVEHINERSALKPGEIYQAALRIRLDTTQLPKPFQIVAVGSRDWNLGSDWRRWQLVLPGAEGR